MLELALLGIFALALLGCVIADISILFPLAFGFILFFAYGLYKKHPAREICKMALSGVSAVRNILLIFILIGMLTGVWRSSGTIAYIVYYSVKACVPSVIILISFLLTAAVSFLTGTSFGTVATVGTICMTIANGLGVSAVWCGGAILSGCFFGDRCSPMSTSALLVCELTKTDIFQNIKRMVKTSLVPFAAACVIYLLAGLTGASGSADASLAEVFRESFQLHPVTLVPAALVLILSLLKVNVKRTMAVSIITAALISLLVQHVSLPELLKIALLGYHPEDAALSALLSGGGIVSMVRVFCIVCLSSSFAGIFQGTGFLDGIKSLLAKVGAKFTAYGGILVTSVLTSMIACNQTLAIMLTHQLCEGLEPDNRKMAIDLENTVVLIAALVPWSIACSVPLSTVGAPVASILAACYLYLLPLWNLLPELWHHRKAVHQAP